MDRNDSLNEHISVRVPKDLKDRHEEISDLFDISLSSLIRSILKGTIRIEYEEKIITISVNLYDNP